MLRGMIACWRGWQHLNHRGYVYVWTNLAAIVISLGIVTAPAAWAAANYVSYLNFRQPNADLNDFWRGLRANLGRGLILAALNFVIVLINLTNLVAYAGETDLFYWLLRAVWVLALVFWFSMQLYLWPLFYQMERPTLTGALRNAAVMTLQNPGFTAGLWIVIVPLVVLSTVLGALWFLVTISALACFANAAVIDRLQAAGLDVPHLRPIDAAGPASLNS